MAHRVCLRHKPRPAGSTMPIRVFGEATPSFTAATASVPSFRFDTVAGRNVVMAFFGRPLSPHARQLLHELRQQRTVFDDAFASFFFVVSDPAHVEALQLREDLPGVRCFVDGDDAIADLYGLSSRASSGARGATVEAAL